MNKKRFIVASASPRRRELLLSAGFEFEVKPSCADEKLPLSISAEKAVEELSYRKAMSVYGENKDAVVLGCDTVVALNDEILTKPKNKEEAFEMLKKLSGKTHSVYTGVCITGAENTVCFTSCTQVKFYQLSDETIRSYIETQEPMDKAGAYGIQGLGSILVKEISGDYFSVVGLPLAQTARALADFGINGSIMV